MSHDFTSNTPEYQAMLDAAKVPTKTTFESDEEAGIVLAKHVQRQASPMRVQAAVRHFLEKKHA